MADRAHLTAETAAVIRDVASKTTHIGGLGGFSAWLLSIDILPWVGLFVVDDNKTSEDITDRFSILVGTLESWDILRCERGTLFPFLA